jgi:hypothetical protein
MATALQLIAGNTIMSSRGLGTNGEFINEITSYQAKESISTIKTIFDATKAANVLLQANLFPVLDSIGTGVSRAQWLIDFYPANITPSSSSAVQLWGNTLPAASFSNTIKQQALLPFANGYTGFANVFYTVYGHTTSVFDIVSSVYLLKNKTYGELGPGYTGPLDLATAGIGTTSDLISGTVSKWGTMYDVDNINSFGDPYVFGQNLLNQGLGKYGDWDVKLSQAGLDITNLPIIPQTTTTVTQAPGVLSESTFIGQVDVPFVSNVVTTTVVTGNSPSVVLNIYKQVTGANLQAIVSATGITTNSASNDITSLADYLNFDKAIDATVINDLKNRGVNSFEKLSDFIQVKVGSGIYKDWKSLGAFLATVDVPDYKSPVTTFANTVAVSPQVSDTITLETGVGTGCFTQPIIRDYLGACMGQPHTEYFKTLNNTHGYVLTSSVTSALNSLKSAVDQYITDGDTWLVDTLLNPAPDITPVSTAVSTLQSALNSVPTTEYFNQAQNAHYQSIIKLKTEVDQLQKIGVVFGPSTVNLLNFGMGISGFAIDDTQVESSQFFANIINRDIYGDTLRSAIAERTNTTKLGRAGIELNNDADPAGKIFNADLQGVPLSTYLSQNK